MKLFPIFIHPFQRSPAMNALLVIEVAVSILVVNIAVGSIRYQTYLYQICVNYL